MLTLQRYLFAQAIGPLLAILGGLTVVAVFTQGLAQLDVIVDQRQSGLAFLWVTLLAMPQVIALILPLALFFALAYTLNRLLSENELVAAYAGGLSFWQLASPVMKLATVAALAHLAVTTLIQPASYREMRETLFEIRADVAASLVREGTFTTSGDNLTIYARETESGGRMRDVLIHDGRDAQAPTTYTAKRGAAATVEGAPGLVLWEGQIQQPKADGSIDLLNFEQYVLRLDEFLFEPNDLLLKPSDRYLRELFFPDPTHFYDYRNQDRFLAEGHGRIAAPLLNFAMACIALAGMLRGDLSRLGYMGRLGRAAGIALGVRLAALGIEAACADDPDLNALQYLFPILVAGTALTMTLGARPARRRARLPLAGLLRRLAPPRAAQPVVRGAE